MIAMREITKAEQEIYKETAKILKGTDRRVFMARCSESIGIWRAILCGERVSVES